MSLHYINKKGARVELNVSHHAKIRFIERFERIYGERLSFDEAETRISSLFKLAKREECIGKKLNSRAKKHSGTSLYFKHGDFRFVISENVVVTVEIASRANRHHNHRIGGMVALIDAVNNSVRYQAAY